VRSRRTIGDRTPRAPKAASGGEHSSDLDRSRCDRERALRPVEPAPAGPRRVAAPGWRYPWGSRPLGIRSRERAPVRRTGTCDRTSVAGHRPARLSSRGHLHRRPITDHYRPRVSGRAERASSLPGASSTSSRSGPRTGRAACDLEDPRRARCEAHLSAEQPPPLAQARLSRPDADACGSTHREQPSTPRSVEALRVTPIAGGHARLRLGSDIVGVLRSRRQRAGRNVVVHVRRTPAEAAGAARVAVIASRRRVGNAVARNRAKRLLREAVRHTPLTSGVDVVLVAREEAVTASMEAIRTELVVLAEHLEILGTSADGPAAASAGAA